MEQRANALGREFLQRFQREMQHIDWAGLLGCDLSRPEGEKEALDRGLFTELCPRFVRGAAAILEEMLRR